MQVKTYTINYKKVWIPKFMRLGGEFDRSHGRLTFRAQVLSSSSIIRYGVCTVTFFFSCIVTFVQSISPQHKTL